jgi:hypothetical protein
LLHESERVIVTLKAFVCLFEFLVERSIAGRVLVQSFEELNGSFGLIRTEIRVGPLKPPELSTIRLLSGRRTRTHSRKDNYQENREPFRPPRPIKEKAEMP